MTSAGSSGGLPPNQNNVSSSQSRSASGPESAANTPPSQNASNSQTPKKAAKSNRDQPILSRDATNAAYAQVAGQIKTSPQKAAEAAGGTTITLADGTRLDLDFSKVHSNTLTGLQNTDFDAEAEDDDGQNLSEQDKNLLSMAFSGLQGA